MADEIAGVCSAYAGYTETSKRCWPSPELAAIDLAVAGNMRQFAEIAADLRRQCPRCQPHRCTGRTVDATLKEGRTSYELTDDLVAMVDDACNIW